MAPINWSREKTMDEFSVTERMVRVARTIEISSGICSLPLPRKGKSLPENIVEKVKCFYQNNENSRIMPGMKDRVSIKKNQHEQKRLPLCTLKELYLSFKEQNQETKMGFSKFCTLRAKWCISAGAYGTHSVCVCTIHQNVVLFLHAAQMEESCKDLIRLAVCDMNNRDCMLQRCNKCPGIAEVEARLCEKFEDTNEDINFRQWTTVDRIELVLQHLPVSDFINVVSSKVSALTPHHFISHSQSSYLRQNREKLDLNSAIILMDFAENFSFHVQDEAQGYHWTHQTCTVHPVVCYYKENDELHHTSICFLSEELQQDVVMVYLIQKKTIEVLETKIPNLHYVEYFTDDCAAQYKNCKSFYNLSKHEVDFGVQAAWSFFATSHGTSPCDGIGGTVKRSTAMESLRRPLENQITTVSAMMTHCKEKLPTISFLQLLRKDLDELRTGLSDRFKEASTIEGTRGFHYFKPLASNKLGMKRISSDIEFSLVVSVQSGAQDVSSQLHVTEGQIICVVYDQKWYIAVVKDVDRNNEDVSVYFMHPNGPSRSFHWPQQSDVCWVPFQHVLCPIDVPSLATTRG